TGLFVAILLPLTLFFVGLRSTRKREFAADAGAVALTQDPPAMISGLARISRNNKKPLEYSALVEWFSTHPSTRKRIRALASAARLDTIEQERSCASDDPGDPYTLPADDTAIFTLGWQNANAARYSWAVLFATSGVGLLTTWLLDEFAGVGVRQLLAGIVLGCALAKLLAAAVMSGNYAHLRRKLARKLGVGGQLVGLAADSVPHVYNGFRFSDAGFLSFQGERLCYRSERTTIALNPTDVVEVGMIAAAPSSWRRMQPIVRFRPPESGEVKSIILHPVEWGATPRRLLHSIERWKATASSSESTTISGFDEVAGRPFQVPTVAKTARGFKIPGAITMVGAVLAGWMLRAESWPVWYALAVTACTYTFMFLPALLYRPSSLPPILAARTGGD
ncbi:MAG TPA: M48 family metalloprotease, partial [Bryobacteraceae bacterium]|nr:M48 family metalloprotease [Bryobacteraceae bacterium]